MLVVVLRMIWTTYNKPWQIKFLWNIHTMHLSNFDQNVDLYQGDQRSVDSIMKNKTKTTNIPCLSHRQCKFTLLSLALPTDKISTE